MTDNRFKMLVMIATLVLSAPVSAQPISGCYASDFGMHGDFRLGQAISLKTRAHAELDFHISFTGVEGHTCIARAIAKRDHSQLLPTFLFERREGDDLEHSAPGYPSPACKLKLVVGRRSVSSEAVSGNCHSYFACGARATLEFSVPRASRKALGSNNCVMPQP